MSAVTVFERLRGYRAAIGEGKPYEAQLRQFEALVACSTVLPFDAAAADRAATIWGALRRRERRALGDFALLASFGRSAMKGEILIAATASVHGLPLVTRNRRDFAPLTKLEGVGLQLLDWAR